MTDMIRVEVGAAPWLPATSAEPVREYHYYDFPLSGLVRQNGIEYLFMCTSGQDDPTNFWAYWPLPPKERRYLESATTPDEFSDRLRGLKLHGTAVIALATDTHGILGWREFDPEVPGAMRKASDDLGRWFIGQVEMALERSREPVLA